MPQVAYAIAHSPLVKTAFFASDPNLGRILAAIGNAGVATRYRKGRSLSGRRAGGEARGAQPGLPRGAGRTAAMKKAEFTVRAVLNRGKRRGHGVDVRPVLDYVKINAEYRT